MAAGDVVIGDSRMLHSTHANQSDQRRTVLTIWYWPDYDDLPDEVKSSPIAWTKTLSKERGAELIAQRGYLLCHSTPGASQSHNGRPE
jgi:ectoine hydroxylase-related dioxygenase (phytanoyl-CoA dioxygenase family)